MDIENKGFKIFNTTTHKFGFKARLLILFGKPLKQSVTITVDKEVEVLKTETSGYIEDLFPRKQKGGMMEITGEKQPIKVSGTLEVFVEHEDDDYGIENSETKEEADKRRRRNG